MSPARVVPWRAITVAPVILISGPQEFFADRAVKTIRDGLRAKNENLEVVEIDAAEYAPAQIFDFARAERF